MLFLGLLCLSVAGIQGFESCFEICFSDFRGLSERNQEVQRRWCERICRHDHPEEGRVRVEDPIANWLRENDARMGVVR